MPVPRFRSLAPALRFEGSDVNERRSSRPSHPQARTEAEAIRLRLRSVRTGRERPILPRLAAARKAEAPRERSPLPSAGSGKPDPPSGKSASKSKANLAIPAAPSSRAWHRSELRSFRSPDLRREANSPSRPVRSLEPKQAPIHPLPDVAREASSSSSILRGVIQEQKLPSFAAGPSAEARTLRIEARRQHRPEANLLPFAARSAARSKPRTSTLRSLDPEQAPSSTAGPHENRNPPTPRFREPSRPSRSSILPTAGPQLGT